MRQLAHILWSTSVVLAVAACGGLTTPTSQSPPEAFPVTISRTGGIAGFRDVLVVAGDGLVSVTRKGQKPRRCRLTPAAASRLTTAVSLMPWSRISPAATQPSFPDEMFNTAQSPAGGPVRLEDPQAGKAGQVFLELLNDVTGAPAASRMCTPL